MRKVKLIVHETYQGNRKSEDVFAAVFLSNAAALTPNVYGNPWVWTYDEGGNIISKTSSPTPPHSNRHKAPPLSATSTATLPGAIC